MRRGNIQLDNATSDTEMFAFLGSEIRQVRNVRQMTLRDLATLANVSVSHLSAIERGNSSPSLEIVHRLSQALDLSSDWFFSRRAGGGPMEQAYVVRRRKRRDLNKLYGESSETLGLTDQLLSSSINGSLCMGLATYEPHSYRPAHPMYKHDGEQHGFIIDGALTLQIGDEETVLETGDSYSFPTNIPHNLRNDTDVQCQLLWAISPIILPKNVVLEE